MDQHDAAGALLRLYPKESKLPEAYLLVCVCHGTNLCGQAMVQAYVHTNRRTTKENLKKMLYTFTVGLKLASETT